MKDNGRILFVTNMGRQYHLMKRVAEHFGAATGVVLDVVTINAETSWSAEWEQRLRTADFSLLTYMGSGLDTAFLRLFARESTRLKNAYLMLIDKDVTPDMYGEIEAADITQVKTYIAYSGLDNFTGLAQWLAHRFVTTDIDYEEPRQLPWEGIWSPADHMVYPHLSSYLTSRGDGIQGEPVGILFYREEWIAGDLAYQAVLAEELEKEGMIAVPFFAQHTGDKEVGSPNLAVSLRRLFGDGHGGLRISALINMSKFSMIGLQSVAAEDLARWNIPILQGYGMYMSESEWRDSVQGMTAMDVNLGVSLPEVDGVIHGGVVAAKTEDPSTGEYRYLPVEERIAALARKTSAWIKLRRKANADKKVVIMFHNYPPDNASIGSAVGLDSIESVRRLLVAMKNAGYVVDTVPADTDELIRDITAHATNDRRYIQEELLDHADGKLHEDAYRQWFRTKSERVRKKMEEDWGTAPGSVFYHDHHLLIPGYRNGHVFITVQPPRGFGEDPGKLYHSPDASPTHQYEAVYYWIRDIFKADAIFHIGTHGTLEWLPGKGTGLSPECYPEMAIDCLPNIYPYWTTIIGEGIQAKRRSAACLIGHLTPPQDRSGLYEGMEEMENLLDEYFHFKAEKPEMLSTLEEEVVKQAKAIHLWEEIRDVEQMSLDELATACHRYLTDIKQMQMRVALHVLGQAPEGRHKQNFLSALLRVRNGSHEPLPETAARLCGWDWDELQDCPEGRQDDGVLNTKHIDDVWAVCERLIAEVENGQNVSTVIAQIFPNLAPAQAETRESLRHTLKWMQEDLSRRLDATSQEMKNALRALCGEYIEPGPGGAPTSGRADILPTGRNFFGVDARRLPTKAAWAIGQQLADDVIRQFIETEGRYPEMVGIVLWAGSNTRSHGQCIAQFLSLIGVRPVWQAGSGRVVGVEVIPLEELGRPRIDVTGRISGLFRDMMPTPSRWLDQAMRLVADLDEPAEMNYIRKHVGDDVEWLMREEGMSREDAFEHARWRIFGDPPGGYGAGVSDLLEEKNWETVDDIAEVYVRWGGHAYTQTSKGEYSPQLFKRRLEQMEVTVQNQDNREVSMLSSDDYNAYHGGLIAAVRSHSGKMPISYAGDSSDRSRVKVRTLREELHRMFRAEAVNPKFIAGMKEHGYKGAADLAKYVAHAYQWDATSAVLEDWMYDEFADKYALDGSMQQWFHEVNPWALQRIAEVLLEAAQRGLWNADAKRQEQLEAIYLEMEGDLEEKGESSHVGS